MIKFCLEALRYENNDKVSVNGLTLNEVEDKIKNLNGIVPKNLDEGCFWLFYEGIDEKGTYYVLNSFHYKPTFIK